jgi:ribosomal protein L12E/L44/L45/RPP1/RPP2
MKTEQNFSGEKIDKNQAQMEVNMILQQIWQTGAVDVEPDRIKEILENLKEDKITPEEAIKKAREIQNNRQDYH